MLRLPNDKIQMAIFGIFVFDNFLVFVLEDFSFHGHYWTVTRYIRPAVSPMPDKQRQLTQIDPCSLFGKSDGVVTIICWRLNIRPGQLQQFVSPFFRRHCVSSSMSGTFYFL